MKKYRDYRNTTLYLLLLTVIYSFLHCYCLSHTNSNIHFIIKEIQIFKTSVYSAGNVIMQICLTNLM